MTGNKEEEAVPKKIAGMLLIVGSVLLATGTGLPVWASASEPAATGQVAVAKININTASREELMRLEGVGPVYADRIIEHRKERGPFEKPEDIMKVKGIGERTWEANEDVITVK
jgi:competence protein ComEA